MKFSIIALAFLSIVSANDVERIQSMVDDITKLRETQASSKVESESKNLNKSESNSKIVELEKKLDEKEKLVKTKESEINSIKKEFAVQQKNQEILLRESRTQQTDIQRKEVPAICQDDNEFPKLIMKENAAKKADVKEVEKVAVETKKVVQKEVTKVVADTKKAEMKETKKVVSDTNKAVEVATDKGYATKAMAYVLKDESAIYSSAGGKKVATWTKGTSFTSNQRTKSWIKVTGYFVNKTWTKASEEFWIEETKVAQK